MDPRASRASFHDHFAPVATDPLPPVADWSAPRASLARRGPRAGELERIAGRVLDGGRITPEEALTLHEHADLLLLGRLSDHVRRARHPEPVVTYIVDRNLNPTNVCITDCGFCAFYRRPDAEGAYVLDARGDLPAHPGDRRPGRPASS